MRWREHMVKGHLAYWLALSVAGLITVYCIIAQDFAGYPEDLTFVFPGLLALGSLLIIARLLTTAGDQKPAGAPVVRSDWRGLLFASVALFGYALVMPFLGFLFSTFLFQGTVHYGVFGERRYGRLLVLSAAMALVFWFFFGVLLTVPLPRGIVFYLVSGMGAH